MYGPPLQLGRGLHNACRALEQNLLGILLHLAEELLAGRDAINETHNGTG